MDSLLSVDIFAKVFAALIGFLATLFSAYVARRSQQRVERTEKKVEKAETEVKEQPEKSKPAWDLARANLDLYFERNRSQVSQVFVIAVIIMIVKNVSGG